MVVYSVTIWVPADGLAHPLLIDLGSLSPWDELGGYNVVSVSPP